jgi:dienelactone hydrolase
MNLNAIVRALAIAFLSFAAVPRILAQAKAETHANQRATAPRAGPGHWMAPAGTSISVDRETGRISMELPTQPIDGSREQQVRFEEWRRHPYPGSGPFPSTREEPDSLPSHTIYRPQDLSKTPKLPVLLWASGGCRNTSVEFTRFLGELASHGYLVIAVGRSDVPFMIVNYNGGLGVLANGPVPNPAVSLQVTDPAVMLRGLDWAVAENSREGSPLFGKVDAGKVAALGQSCGGTQAFRAARDPRIKTVLALNSGFPTKASDSREPNTAADWTAEKLAIPAALFEGGPADLAYASGEASFQALPETTSVLKANMPLLGHTGAYAMPDIRWTRGVLAWFDWQLKGEAEALKMFSGPSCTMCTDDDWWVQSRNLR